MKISGIIKVSIIFLIGFLSANLISLYVIDGFETPLSYLGFGFNNLQTPFDFVDRDDIQIFDDRVVIYVDGASLGRYAPTGSMEPILNENSNGIRIKPQSIEDIHIGDIITFRKDGYLIVHRVVDIGNDDKGVYFITKGDNNDIADGKVRYKDVEYITIGVIW